MKSKSRGKGNVKYKGSHNDGVKGNDNGKGSGK
jgi:hypothetical protein